MFPEKRSPENKDKHLHRIKSSADNESKALSNSGALRRARTGTKAYSIKYVTMSCCIRIKQQQLKVGQWGSCSLIDDLHTQLNGKCIKNSKDHLWTNKYRERAKVYMQDLYEVGRAEFIIDASDLHGKAKSVLYKLDDDSAEFVIREVIDRIFESIGVRDFKLTQKYCVF